MRSALQVEGQHHEDSATQKGGPAGLLAKNEDGNSHRERDFDVVEDGQHPALHPAGAGIEKEKSQAGSHNPQVEEGQRLGRINSQEL